MLKKFLLAGAGLFVVAILVIAFFLWRHSLAGGDPAFYESEILAFEQSDRIIMPEPGAIVLTGSSSIRLWETLAADMAPLRVIQRGFGGAHMEHVVYNVLRIVTAYSPRAVAFLARTGALGNSTFSMDCTSTSPAMPVGPRRSAQGCSRPTRSKVFVSRRLGAAQQIDRLRGLVEGDPDLAALDLSPDITLAGSKILFLRPVVGAVAGHKLLDQAVESRRG